MIGRLQSNKAEEAAAVRRHPLARPPARCSTRWPKAGGALPDVYVQVNIGEEEQKGGCAIAELPAFLAAVRARRCRSPG
jgi:uncharacterized pyridoxal phosphate-containing UPF0001 family protein